MSVFQSWYEEKQSAFLYRLIATNERDATRQKLFAELATVAEKQADIWQSKLIQAGEMLPVYQPNFRVRIVAKLLQWFGARHIRFILAAMKVRGMSVYTNTARFDTSSAAHHENKHRGINAAGNLRAAVFGMNDGLVSNMSLLLGVVGGSANHNMIILSGVAGLLAGACSMAAESLSPCSRKKNFLNIKLGWSAKSSKLYPEEEADELACIYRARGLPDEDAKRLAK